jgi:SOS-response transcriptional repressor LexA
MTGLTPRQAKMLGYLVDCETLGKEMPTLRELGAALGIKSIGGTHRMLRELQARGHIRRMHNRPRAIEIIDTECVPVLSALTGEDRQFILNYAKAEKTTPKAIIAEWLHTQISDIKGAAANDYVEGRTA